MGEKILQVWHLGSGYAAEHSLDDAINTVVSYGWTALLFKALDGTNWHASYASEQDAIGSVSDAANFAQRCHDAGLKFYVWTNPLSNHNINTQGRLTGELANATDGVFLDFEPYAGFWGAWRPEGLAEQLMLTIRNTAPGGFLVAQPDPRPARLAELRFAEIAPHVDVIAGQHYWSDFYVAGKTLATVQGELAYAKVLGETWGKPVWPTTPGNADAKGWGLETIPLDQLGAFGGFATFRLGTTGPAMLSHLGTVVFPDQPEPPPQPQPDPDNPCAAIEQQYQGALTAIAHMGDALGDVIDSGADELRMVADRLDQIGHGTEAAQVRTVAEAIDAAQEQGDAIREQFVGPRPAVQATRTVGGEMTTASGLAAEGADTQDSGKGSSEP